MSTQTVTRQGDTWDIISKRVYGDEHYMDVLINANIAYRRQVIFPYGIRLTVPDVDTSSSGTAISLPPWKQS